MSAYTTRWCKRHGDWDDDVDNPAEGCPMCIESGAFKTRAQLERELNEAQAKNVADEHDAELKCPTCGKKVKHNGLSDHQRGAHKEPDNGK